MKLFIDTSDRDKVRVGLDNKIQSYEAKRDKSQILLPAIKKLLAKKNKRITDLTQIEVNTGPGSFTGLRVGLSVANTVGWLLKIPVNGKNVEKEGPIEPIYE